MPKLLLPKVFLLPSERKHKVQSKYNSERPQFKVTVGPVSLPMRVMNRDGLGWTLFESFLWPARACDIYSRAGKGEG